MNGWELTDLMQSLTDAQNGNTVEVDSFVKAYTLSAVTKEYTHLIILRNFQVTEYEDTRNVLNCEPTDENIQIGITIASVVDSASMQTNIYLPNNITYTGLEIDGESITIEMEGGATLTNITELCNKGWLKEKTDEIEHAFNSLTNEFYPEIEKPIVERIFIFDIFFGELVYNDTVEWYEGNITYQDKNFDIYFEYTDDKKIDTLIEKAKAYISGNLHLNALTSMVPEMIELKNTSWLEEDEIPITLEKFKELIQIESIKFSDSGYSIYCSDGDVFWGHAILIDVDQSGNYVSSTLAG